MSVKGGKGGCTRDAFDDITDMYMSIQHKMIVKKTLIFGEIGMIVIKHILFATLIFLICIKKTIAIVLYIYRVSSTSLMI